MLTEERYHLILQTLQEKKTIKITELCEMLNSSVSTIRRDLNTLDEMGKLNKVHGGATVKEKKFIFEEETVQTKEKCFQKEKDMIAKYAASLIEEDDFVFIDAGTTTLRMISYLPQKKAVYVTNGFMHAKHLAELGHRVFITGGQIKASTEAVVGAECIAALNNFNFTKSFLGVNGIALEGGLSTPDMQEASVKRAVVKNSLQAYALADHSKFDKITAVTFASLLELTIITDCLEDEKYQKAAKIIEVG
ncbi:MAG: DeoR/GlpR family DNA-binding transcription regulator [Lachnospiraceae bacterium]|nr:DeoR/GlpR family DNA-binding transcription regulator [Lachnospiraceae bacterium]